MACNKCHKATGVDYNEEFSCFNCKEKAVANPRCRLEVNLDNATGHLMATLFGDEAEKFLSCSAIKLMNETTKDGIKNIKSFVKRSADKNFLIQVRAIKLDTPAEPRHKFSIVAIMIHLKKIHENEVQKELRNARHLLLELYKKNRHIQKTNRYIIQK